LDRFFPVIGREGTDRGSCGTAVRRGGRFHGVRIEWIHSCISPPSAWEPTARRFRFPWRGRRTHVLLREHCPVHWRSGGEGFAGGLAAQGRVWTI